MGSYIYGFTGEVRSVKRPLRVPDTLQVGVFAYMYKPGLFHQDLPATINRKITNCRKRTNVPDYVVLGEFREGVAIHCYAKRTGTAGVILQKESVTYDDPWGFGPVVGFLKKQGTRWLVTYTHTHTTNMQLASGVPGPSSVFTPVTITSTLNHETQMWDSVTRLVCDGSIVSAISSPAIIA